MSKDTLSFRTLTGFQILILLFALTPNLLAQKTKPPLIGLSTNTPITINTTSGVTAPIKGSLYPSTIEVTGISEPVQQVFLTLNGVNHTAMSNLDMMLVSPNGEKYIFLADGGPIFAQVDDKVYTFADSASETLPFIPAPSGTYKPTSGDNIAETFPAPVLLIKLEQIQSQ